MAGYFVTVVRDVRVGWALGPFETHNAALGQVAKVQKYCIECDPWCAFDLFGTAHTDADVWGKLNPALGYFRTAVENTVGLGLAGGRVFSFSLGDPWADRILSARSVEDLEFLHDECVVTFANGWD